MGELHVNMTTTLDGVIQANGCPSEQDGDFEYAGWERPFWESESGEQVVADVQGSDALLLGRTMYDILRSYWADKIDEIRPVFDRVPKYVASRGTPELSWDASSQITDVGAEVRDRVCCISRSRGVPSRLVVQARGQIALASWLNAVASRCRAGWSVAIS